MGPWPPDELVWDEGNLRHATRHGVLREEIDGMYAAGRWVAIDDPLGRQGQERLIGEVPASGRLVTVAIEWIKRGEEPTMWQRRPISAWEARPHEVAAWLEDFEDV